MADDENFANAPVSITELRANRSFDCRDWTPRDALVDLLRRIDSGELANIDGLIICYREKDEQGQKTRFSAAVPDYLIGLGLLTRVAYLINDMPSD